MKVLVTNYHISVNRTLVDDLVAVGCEIIMPDSSFNIDFFADNSEHQTKVRIVNKQEFMGVEPLAILIPCMQLVDDFIRIYEERGKVDQIVLLTANSDHSHLWESVPTDFLLSHDLTYHRLFKGRYKTLYFSRPTVLLEPKTDGQIRKSFDEKKIKLYINNFYKPGFELELDAAEHFREAWEAKTGWHIPFYGFDNPDGWPSMKDTQSHMLDSMFTLASKRRETWGQCVNESMLLKTPCIFFTQFFNSTFTEYEMNQDTAIIGQTVEDIVANILNMRFEDYETLVNESYHQADMFCNDANRQSKLQWLLGKVEQEFTK